MHQEGTEGTIRSADDVPLPAWAPELVDATDPALGLRGHRPEDVPWILEQCRDPGTRRWTDVPDPYRAEHAERYVRDRPQEWAQGRRLSLAVEVEGRFAGTVGLRPRPGTGLRVAELAFGIAPWARGRGRGAQAVRLLLSWAFDLLPLQHVTWRTPAGNWAGRRTAWQVGVTWHGAVPGMTLLRGVPTTAWLGSLDRTAPLRPAHAWLTAPELVGASRRDGGGPVMMRPHRDDDADRVVGACADPTTQHWLPQLPHPYTAAHARAFLQECREDQALGRAVHWAVARGRRDPLLAEVGLYLRSPAEAEIGYWSHPDGRSRGVVGAAVRLAARHALIPAEDGGLGRRRVLIRVAAGNVASRRAALAAGFREAGVDRDGERLRDGTVVDMHRFDLVAAECP